MDNITTLRTTRSEETSQFGEKIAVGIVKTWQQALTDEQHIFCLYGDLGSGKTTFTKGFARGLGIETRVVSPTFLISKRYSTQFEGRYFYHLDIYRIDSPADFETIGLTEILSDIRSVCIIEWAEKLQSFLPKHRTDLFFRVNDDGSHQIDISHL